MAEKKDHQAAEETQPLEDAGTGTEKPEATASWDERLAQVLSPEEIQLVLEGLRADLAARLAKVAAMGATDVGSPLDIKALQMWRDRHRDYHMKPKSIRATEEYGEILARLVDDSSSQMEALVDATNAVNSAATIDEVVSLRHSRKLRKAFPGGHVPTGGAKKAFAPIVSSYQQTEEYERQVADGVDAVEARIRDTLRSGTLSGKFANDIGDLAYGYYWNRSRKANISDASTLQAWLGPDGNGHPIVVRRLASGDSLGPGIARNFVKKMARGEQLTVITEFFDSCYAKGKCRDLLRDIDKRATKDIAQGAIERVTRDDAMDLLAKNPRYAAMIDEIRRREERERRIMAELSGRMPAKPADLYPVARAIHRHFVLHVGPTNSGKTHDAVEALGRAESGVYLAPLRLLAYEQYDRLNSGGCACSMLTGEEEISVSGASHVSSTVEMLDLSKPIDVAVIDECQMMGDPDRGGRWTEAILGVPAKEIHACMAPEAENLVCSLVEACGDDYEVVRHERKVPLRQETGSFSFPKDVRDGDALVVFSRRSVHAVAAELSRNGIPASTIYGALPYDVRHREAERFASGQTRVVVATDAIGMGMNLPIRRVILLEQAKFDGRTERLLLAPEIRQITGRAGRYGQYDLGLWRSDHENKKFGRLAEQPPVALTRAPIGFIRTLLSVEGNVSDLMVKWAGMKVSRPFSKLSLEREIELASELEGVLDSMADVTGVTKDSEEGKRLVYRFATLPFKERDAGLHSTWLKMFNGELPGMEPYEVIVPSGAIPNSMAWLESQYAYLDLLYQYCRVMGLTERYEEIDGRRRIVSDRICELISKSVFEARTCRECGKPMPWNWPYPMCDPCHSRLYPPRRWDYWDGGWEDDDPDYW